MFCLFIYEWRKGDFLFSQAFPDALFFLWRLLARCGHTQLSHLACCVRSSCIVSRSSSPDLTRPSTPTSESPATLTHGSARRGSGRGRHRRAAWQSETAAPLRAAAARNSRSGATVGSVPPRPGAVARCRHRPPADPHRATPSPVTGVTWCHTASHSGRGVTSVTPPLYHPSHRQSRNIGPRRATIPPTDTEPFRHALSVPAMAP